LGCPDGELSILLVDDPQIAKLNQEYLGRPGPTNVIAFPMGEGEHSGINPQLLGDVVISTETARREAEQEGFAPETRFTELLIHGILHLFGFDHEGSEAEDRRMSRKAEDMLKLVYPGPRTS